MSLLDNLPHECTIKRRTHSKSAVGGRNTSNSTISTGVACWEQQLKSNYGVVSQQEGLENYRRVYFVSDPNITTNHRIIITKRNGTSVASSSQVELKPVGNAVPDASSGYGILYRVTCVIMTQEEN